MLFADLPAREAQFALNAAPFLTPFALDVPGESGLALRGQVYTPTRTDYFYANAYPKERIVLHFTAGNLSSDMQVLTQQNRHVSTAFVLARNGTIYLLFPSRFWSGHLGAGYGNVGQPTVNPQDKATIGIEISNYGVLEPRNGGLETIYNDPYCALTETAAYQRLIPPFRGYTYFPTFTPAQYDSLIVLLRFLTSTFGIQRQFLPEPKRYQATPDVVDFRGIVSHVNYRPTGKWDIGPAFDWATVTAGVRAITYVLTTPQIRDLRARELTSEEAIEALFPQSRNLFEPERETTDNAGYNPNDFDELPG